MSYRLGKRIHDDIQNVLFGRSDRCTHAGSCANSDNRVECVACGKDLGVEGYDPSIDRPRHFTVPLETQP